MVIYHISAGTVQLHFNDISTPAMNINAGENLAIPVLRDYIRSIVLVSTQNCTCDVLQFEDGATETHFMWS